MMNKLFRSLIFLAFLPTIVSGCSLGNGKRAFTPHELQYGGDSEEVISVEQFVSEYKTNYQKKNKYKNAYVTVTSDQSFYMEGDRDDYFKRFEELRFFGVLNDEDRGFAFEQPFKLIPLNFRLAVIATQTAMASYHFGRSLSTIYQWTSYQRGNDLIDYTFTKYKAASDNITVCFSSDYYITSLDAKYEECSFHFSFSYFNVNDLPNTREKVDKETFLLCLLAKSNQEVKYNYAHLSMDIINSPINMYLIYNPDYDIFAAEYDMGDAHIEANCKKGSRLDKTALRMIYAPSDSPSYVSYYQDTSDIVYSDNLEDEEKVFIRQHYLGSEPQMVLNFRCLFDNSELFSMVLNTFNYVDETIVRGEYTISPLSCKSLIMSEEEETGEFVVSKSYVFSFNDDGLLSYLSAGYGESSEYDYAIAKLTYSNSIPA